MRILLTAIVLAALGAPALAQQPSESTSTPYIKLDCPDLGDPTPQQASMANCYAMAARDKKMLAHLKIMMAPDIHEEQGNLMARNEKHVVMAYAALWILAVVFLTLLFFRQRMLTAEIVALKTELDRVIRDEGGAPPAPQTTKEEEE